MSHNTKIKFRDLQKQFKGHVILLNYADSTKTLAFTPVEDIDNQMRCECGSAEWNATNFGNLIHFCPTREIEVTITDFIVTNK